MADSGISNATMIDHRMNFNIIASTKGKKA